MHLAVTERVDEIWQLVEQDRHGICQEIPDALSINHMTDCNNLKRTDYKKKLETVEKMAETQYALL